LVEEGLEGHDAVRRERGQPALKVVLSGGPARRVLQAVGDQLPECVDVSEPVRTRALYASPAGGQTDMKSKNRLQHDQ